MLIPWPTKRDYAAERKSAAKEKARRLNISLKHFLLNLDRDLGMTNGDVQEIKKILLNDLND